jgi:uncharacterized protein YaaR (DUF327 family)
VERVGPADRSSSYPTKRRRGAVRGEKIDNASFSNILDDTQLEKSVVEGADLTGEREEYRGSLSELLDEIYEFGDRVKKEPDKANVIAYKKAVERLVRIVLSKGVAVEEQTSSPNILKQKRFTLIKVIDQKLDRLVSGVLMSQRDTMDILGRIDEINGLLVDLTS